MHYTTKPIYQYHLYHKCLSIIPKTVGQRQLRVYCILLHISQPPSLWHKKHPKFKTRIYHCVTDMLPTCLCGAYNVWRMQDRNFYHSLRCDWQVTNQVPRGSYLTPTPPLNSVAINIFCHPFLPPSPARPIWPFIHRYNVQHVAVHCLQLTHLTTTRCRQ